MITTRLAYGQATAKPGTVRGQRETAVVAFDYILQYFSCVGARKHVLTLVCAFFF